MQVAEELAKIAVEYNPAPHPLHVEEELAPSAEEYSPPPHPLQLVFAPRAVEKDPARHRVQLAAPTTDEYVPAAQNTQSLVQG